MGKNRIKLVNSPGVCLFAKTDISLKNATKMSSRITTKEGFLLVSGVVSRPGIYEYYVGEIPTASLPERFKNATPDKILRVLYPGEEVFSNGHLDSIVNKPVTWGHPPEMVNSRNVTFFQGGFVKDTVRENGGVVTADLVIQDVGLINAITVDKQEELSTGVESDIDWEPGTDPVHGPYDARVSNIMVNHVAVVSKGRAGESVRLNNNQTSEKRRRMERQITINGVTFTVSNQVAQAVDKLMEGQNVTAEKLHSATAELANTKTKKEELEGRIASLEQQLNDTEAMDAKVSERQALVNRAKELYPEIDVTKKTNGDIIKEVVVKLTNSKMEGQSEAYLRGRFDGFHLSSASSSEDMDAQKTVLKNILTGSVDSKKEEARKKLEARNERRKNAWKTKA